MEWLGIKEWVWILIFCAIGCALVNPILYFIKWELYNRKQWIADKCERQWDDRFWVYQGTEKVQIAEVRPQIKDIARENDDCFYWWFPGFNYFVFLYLVFYLIFRPTKEFWRKIVKWFGNIKV